MNLNDPNRPTINHHPAFIGGLIAIPSPHVLPIDKNLLEVSMMLPVKEFPGFAAKWFKITIPPKEFLTWLESFQDNPEETITKTFSKGDFTPNLAPKSHPATRPTTSKPLDIIDNL